MATRLLPLDRYPVFEEPDFEVFSMDAGSSQFHLMLRHMQRDHGMISDHEMALAEQVMCGRLSNVNDQQRIMFNPFTREIKKEILKERQKLWK